MAMTSFGGGGGAFAPFWNPASMGLTSSRGGRDMHLDVVEVSGWVEAKHHQARKL